MKRLFFLLLVGIFTFNSCKKDETPTAPQNHLPKIESLTANPATVLINTEITLTCIATDEDGDKLTITWSSKRGTFPNGVVGVAVKWVSPPTTGTDTINVIVNDGKQTIQGKIIIIVGEQANPIIKIITPFDNSIVLDTLIVSIEATDDKGIAKVEIYVDNQTSQDKTLLTPPFTFKWINPQTSDSTKHSLYAKAYDTDNNVTSTPIIYFTTYRFSPPSNLTFEEISNNSVRILWKDNSIGESGFIIEKKVNSGVFQEIGRTLSNVNNYIDNDADDLGTNSYRIKAFSQNKFTSYSTSMVLSYLTQIKLTKTLSNSCDDIDVNQTTNDMVIWSGYISIIDSNGTVIKNNIIPESGATVRIIWTPDGRYLLYTSFDTSNRIINVIDTKNNYISRRIYFYNAKGSAFDVSPDSKNIVCGGEIKNIETNTTLQKFDFLPSTILLLKYSENGKYLIASVKSSTTTPGNFIKLIDVNTGFTLLNIPVEDIIYRADFLNNDEMIVAVQTNGVIKIWDRSSGALISSVDYGPTVDRMKVWHGKNLLLSAHTVSRTLQITDSSGKLINTLSSILNLSAIAIFPNSDKFVISANGMKIFYKLTEKHWQKI